MPLSFGKSQPDAVRDDCLSAKNNTLYSQGDYNYYTSRFLEMPVKLHFSTTDLFLHDKNRQLKIKINKITKGNGGWM